jgi:hypothetical protein
MNAETELKMFFNEKLKRFTIPETFQDLISTISKIFNINLELSKYELYYIDDENDSISVSNEFDFAQMKFFTKKYSIKVLKLVLSKNVNKDFNVEKMRISEVSNLSEDKEKNITGHSVYTDLLKQLKSSLNNSRFQDKHLLNALVLSKGDINKARQRLSNEELNFCDYYAKRKFC